MTHILPSASPGAALRAAGLDRAPAAAKSAPSAQEQALAVAQDFEAVFLNAMIQEMFTGMEGEGPLGGGVAGGVWRSFLAEEYAKSFAKAGGVGISADVYRTLLAQQEVRAR
ncbi:MAG: flagellar assembly peptidoglycan hydrolase FlgJ [Variibacter sp.]|nr:flagellar assembly peptidoglycan hydrolase FlgJ [Variibacter sp.]